MSAELPDDIAHAVVGRRTELRLLLSAIRRGKAVLLLGLPGVSKTTMLRALAGHLGQEPDRFVDVTGDEQLTAHALVGTFDPPMVLKDGYRPEHFVPGPLVRAMRAGGIVYLEEVNRAPSGALNVLITALSERYLEVPRLGRVDARPGFTVVGAANPLDDVGTARCLAGSPTASSFSSSTTSRAKRSWRSSPGAAAAGRPASTRSPSTSPASPAAIRTFATAPRCAARSISSTCWTPTIGTARPRDAAVPGLHLVCGQGPGQADRHPYRLRHRPRDPGRGAPPRLPGQCRVPARGGHSSADRRARRGAGRGDRGRRGRGRDSARAGRPRDRRASRSGPTSCPGWPALAVAASPASRARCRWWTATDPLPPAAGSPSRLACGTPIFATSTRSCDAPASWCCGRAMASAARPAARQARRCGASP